MRGFYVLCKSIEIVVNGPVKIERAKGVIIFTP
jgi:hypothetical protein